MTYIAYLPGALMILFGIIIVVVPEVLVALIATFFIGGGISLLGIAHSIRRNPFGGSF